MTSTWFQAEAQTIDIAIALVVAQTTKINTDQVAVKPWTPAVWTWKSSWTSDGNTGCLELDDPQ